MVPMRAFPIRPRPAHPTVGYVAANAAVSPILFFIPLKLPLPGKRSCVIQLRLPEGTRAGCSTPSPIRSGLTWESVSLVSRLFGHLGNPPEVQSAAWSWIDSGKSLLLVSLPGTVARPRRFPFRFSVS